MKLRNLLFLAFIIPVLLSVIFAFVAVRQMILSDREAWELVILMTSASVLGLAASYFLLRPTFRGIRSLRDQIKTIANHDFQPVKVAQGPTEIKQLSDDFNQMAADLHDSFKEIERVNTERTTMVAQLSHDIKTPLTSIRSQTEAMIDGVVTQDEVPQTLESIEQQVTRLANLTDELRTLSTTDESHATIELNDQVYIDQVLVVILDAVKQRIQSEKRQVEIDLAPNAMSLVSNRQGLERIVQNLITNALKYSAPGTPLKITATQDNRHWQMSVTDQGLGISKQEQTHIFDRMYRVEKSRNAKTGGSGLGLYIARQLAREMHGDLTVVSELGRGSTFTVSLPIN